MSAGNRPADLSCSGAMTDIYFPESNSAVDMKEDVRIGEISLLIFGLK